MATVDIGTKDDLAKEIEDRALDAAATEMLLTQIQSVLIAINEGGLLDVLPESEPAAAGHNAAVNLLADLIDRIQAYEDRPGTDLSIKLHGLSSRVSKGAYAHRRILENIDDMPSLTAAN